LWRSLKIEKQAGSVKEYQCQFEKLLSRVGKLSQAHQVGSFVSGLKENIKMEVQAAKPATLTTAVGLSRLYEARVLAQRKPSFDSKPRPYQSQGRNQNSPSIHNSTPTIKKLIESEMKERRERGLCFNCDEKFRLGHRCKKLFLIEGIYPTEDDSDEDLEPPTEEATAIGDGVPEISLNALTCLSMPQTMRVCG